MPHVERPDAWVPADEGAPQEERLDAGFVPTRTFGDVGCPLVSGSYSDFPHTCSDEGVCAGHKRICHFGQVPSCSSKSAFVMGEREEVLTAGWPKERSSRSEGPACLQREGGESEAAEKTEKEEEEACVEWCVATEELC